MWTREELRKQVEPIVLNEDYTQQDRAEALARVMKDLLESIKDEDAVSFQDASELWNLVMVEIIDDNHLRRH